MQRRAPACKSRPAWHVGGVTRPILIGSEIYRGSTYGPKHPLAIPRVSTMLDLVRAMGWVEPAQYRDSPIATPAQLTRFHTPDYVAALMRAEAQGRVCEVVARMATRCTARCSAGPPRAPAAPSWRRG